MRQQVATADAAVAQLAARQHGIVSFGQLRGKGLSASAVSRRVRAGRLHRIYRGLYAVGHPAVSQEGRWLAAVAAVQSGSRSSKPVALSHRSAAALWTLLPSVPGPVEISIVGLAGRRGPEGIRVHRSRTLSPGSITRRKQIPVTTPARTVADLKAVVSASELRRAVRRAGVLGFALDDETATAGTRSDLELVFLRLCRRHRLPMPEVNTRIGPIEVDFLWRDQQLVVETDGYRYHRGRAAFEGDRSRDLALRGRGFEVIRLSHRQVVKEQARVAAVLRAALGRAQPPGV